MSMAIKLGFCARKSVAGLGLALGLWLPAAVLGQTNYYATNGTQYAIVGSLPGDQVHPDVAVDTNGNGYVVWQDNATDGSGWGISATRLESWAASLTWSDHRVNSQGADDQECPRVALLQNGGAVFVWQGGPSASQHIYARFLGSNSIWLTNDVLVNTFTNNFQETPAVATLANGNVIIVWASYDEAGPNSMQDVYGRIFSPTGTPVTGEFLINSQFISYNQRSPAVAALANGGFVVAWVSEQQRATAPSPGSGSFNVINSAPTPSVDIYAQLYNSNGVAQGTSQLVNSDFNPCADPAVAAGSDGGFMIVWDARDMSDPLGNALDIYARSFSSADVGGTISRVNTYLYGDQYAPRVAALGTDYLVVWTSLAQDGSREGVYGQFLRGDGSMLGSEFRVNTTTANSQIQPAVASDGTSQFLAVWTSFTGLQYGFDLYAQRYSNGQEPLERISRLFVWAPFVLSSNVYQPQLVVSWPPVADHVISYYEVYVDGAATNLATTSSNTWTMTAANGLTTSSSNYFQVDYVTADGRRSPLSPAAGNTTWNGYNWGGIPFEWMMQYYGGDFSKWPAADTPVVSGGPTLLQVFLSGGDPTNSATWLQTVLDNSKQGLYLGWNAQPGLTYQVQVSTNLVSWTDFNAPWFASDTNGWMYVGGHPAGYYRVVLLRQ